MTWIDWVIIAFALFAALQGLRRGVLPALMGILAVLLSYLAASAWYLTLGDVIEKYIHLSRGWSDTVAFLAVFLLAYDVIAILTVMAIGTEKVPAPSRFAGAAVGLFRGAVLAAALLVVIIASPPGQPIRDDVERSAAAPFVVDAFRDGLRGLRVVIPPTIHVFGLQDERF
ncbi:MAG TPA: CvpA family protein [bacterium]|nr:CvpA family protein [bacterium]